jgi:hypothetical protein
MKWTAIAGSWRKTNKKVEADVKRTVRKIIKKGNGIISGGALGVDYFTLDEAMRANPDCEKIKIILPAPLNIFTKHFFKRAKEGVITYKQAKDLIIQLNTLKKINPEALIENQNNKIIDKNAYYQRIKQIIAKADSLVAFQVNKSKGTQYTIDIARQKGLPIRKYFYVIN